MHNPPVNIASALLSRIALKKTYVKFTEFSKICALITFSLMNFSCTTSNETVQIVELDRFMDHNDIQMESVAWSNDGNMLAFGNANGLTYVGEISSITKSFSTIKEYQGPSFQSEVSWARNTDVMVVTGMDTASKQFSLWKLNQQSELEKFFDYDEYRLEDIAWSPDGRLFALGGSDLQIVRSEDFIITNKWELPLRLIKKIDWSPDSHKIAVGGARWEDGIVIIWDVDKNEMIYTLNEHTDAVTSVAWSPDGLELVSAGFDQTLKVWNATNGQEIASIKMPNVVADLAWSPDGEILAVSGENIWLWNVRKQELIATINFHSAAIVSIDWHPDGNLLASASWDGSVRIWNVVRQ